MKILHIEDDPEIQTTVELLFQVVMPDAAFIASGTGTEGIELVRLSQPDIVLLDLGLPDISGFDVITGIRGFSQVPVIVITARREPGIKNSCLEMGANDFICKPFNHRQVIESINKVLAGEGKINTLVK